MYDCLTWGAVDLASILVPAEAWNCWQWRRSDCRSMNRRNVPVETTTNSGHGGKDRSMWSREVSVQYIHWQGWKHYEKPQSNVRIDLLT